MSTAPNQQQFLDHCRRVLGPLSLMPLVMRTISALDQCKPQFAYYFNPHLVATRVLACPADARDRVMQAISIWAAATAGNAAPRSTQTSARPGLTGVPDGRSLHEELYFDTTNATGPLALHRAGMSFRVRVTSDVTLANEYSSRVLMILTHHPVVTLQRTPTSGQDYWDAMNSAGPADFEALLPFKSASWASDATPSVAHCFVVYLKRAEGIEKLLDYLAGNETGPSEALARLRKDSFKFAIRPWLQNPLTGEMQPDWAYAALDRIQTNLVHSNGPLDLKWLNLDQIELEVGPSSELAAIVMRSLVELDRELLRLADSMTPAFGRKIHRILLEQGFAMGLDVS